MSLHQTYTNDTKSVLMKYLKTNKLALWNDPAIHIVPIPPIELSQVNAFEIIAKLTFLQTQNEQINNTHTQPMYSSSTSANQNTNSSHQNQNIHPYDQSTVTLQEFSMVTQELSNFMDKVPGDITKITQVCIVAQENTGK